MNKNKSIRYIKYRRNNIINGEEDELDKNSYNVI